MYNSGVKNAWPPYYINTYTTLLLKTHYKLINLSLCYGGLPFLREVWSCMIVELKKIDHRNIKTGIIKNHYKRSIPNNNYIIPH